MTISNQIIEVIDALCLKFGIAIDWTQENVLPYLQTLMQKYISYELWTSVMWIVIMVVCFTIALKLNKKAKKLYDENDFDDTNTALFIISSIIVCFVAVALFVVTCVQTLDIITCLTFPEKIIFDFITSSVSAS